MSGFDYDPRPILIGSSGAGTLNCPVCYSPYSCKCEIPNCHRNAPTYAKHGCNVTGCVKHSNRS